MYAKIDLTWVKRNVWLFCLGELVVRRFIELLRSDEKSRECVCWSVYFPQQEDLAKAIVLDKQCHLRKLNNFRISHKSRCEESLVLSGEDLCSHHENKWNVSLSWLVSLIKSFFNVLNGFRRHLCAFFGSDKKDWKAWENNFGLSTVIPLSSDVDKTPFCFKEKFYCPGSEKIVSWSIC